MVKVIKRDPIAEYKIRNLFGYSLTGQEQEKYNRYLDFLKSMKNRSGVLKYDFEKINNSAALLSIILNTQREKERRVTFEKLSKETETDIKQLRRTRNEFVALLKQRFSWEFT